MQAGKRDGFRTPTWLAACCLGPDRSLRRGTMIVAMAVWVWLNALDLVITYHGLGSGRAYEANRAMAVIIQHPVLAASVKLMLAYVVLRLVERLETRHPYSGLAPLLAVNVYLAWACLHNLYVISGQHDWSGFLRCFPLAGLPG